MASVFHHFTLPIWLLVIIGAALLHAALAPRSANPLSKYPLVSRRRWYDVLGFWERAEFLLMGARKPLVAAKEYELGQAFRIRDPWGEILVLPAEDAQYLKSHTSFAFELFFNGRTHASLNDGLAGFLELAKLPNIVSQGVKNNLTQVSNRWEEIPVSDAVVKIVHRVSSRTFIGDDGPRNAEWLDLAQNYTPDVSFAGFILDLMPPQLRPLLALTFVADHTSANFIMMVLLDLARHPEVAKEVRREIEQEVNQIGWMGWEKGNLHRMKLLDSVIKESMRLRPIFFAAMLGGVTEAMSLKDGTVLPVGTRIAVAGDGNRDPAVYDRPDEWDAYRFYKMRQTGDREDMAQLACATVEHAGFGVGKHSCPGRFYAADVMKIVLCHLLMKYDWKTLEGGPETVIMGWTQMIHPEAKILVRRRG
ncbi:cytochrome P450 [Colletotrichum navitas]|uniref:Cytochrome P450 n=1 Tax=Colletotrichum navitas TaxID=681940 RepID=A0AAD8PXN3_9PEZI|nr:cytochrome P450 [Colletotrichum navitas]KAK1589821.1 cytochrome P450 [Colletotrichum navitas]